jgi:hypothetical protein
VNSALVAAAESNKNNEIVSLLLGDDRIKPAIVNEALIAAADFSWNKETVSLLLDDKRIEPAIVSRALVAAAGNNYNEEIVSILLDDNRIDPEDVHDAFELDLVNICKVAKYADIFSLYMKFKQNIWSQIIENLGKNPIMVKSEIARIPAFSLHAHNALQMLIETGITDKAASSHVLALTEKLAILYHKLENLSNIPHMERPRTSLLLVPHSVFSSLKQMIAESVLGENAQSMLQEFVEEVSSANTRFEAYLAQFQESLSNDFDGRKRMC